MLRKTKKENFYKYLEKDYDDKNMDDLIRKNRAENNMEICSFADDAACANQKLFKMLNAWLNVADILHDALEQPKGHRVQIEYKLLLSLIERVVKKPPIAELRALGPDLGGSGRRAENEVNLDKGKTFIWNEMCCANKGGEDKYADGDTYYYGPDGTCDSQLYAVNADEEDSINWRLLDGHNIWCPDGNNLIKRPNILQAGPVLELPLQHTPLEFIFIDNAFTPTTQIKPGVFTCESAAQYTDAATRGPPDFFMDPDKYFKYDLRDVGIKCYLEYRYKSLCNIYCGETCDESCQFVDLRHCEGVAPAGGSRGGVGSMPDYMYNNDDDSDEEDWGDRSDDEDK